MNKYEAFDRLIISLENICGRFVIKDFVGFLNWEPTLGALLLPYTGHHFAFCQSIKQNAGIYSRCVACSTAHRRLCQRKQEAFLSSCYLGVSEYSVPIMIDEFCIGSISVGNFCLDPEDAAIRLRREAIRQSVNSELLIQLFHSSVTAHPPSEEGCAVFQFVAAFLAEEFRPYAHRAALLNGTKKPADSGFEMILTYIFNNYTSPTINVASIAEACSYSESYVSHTFSRKMKTNIRTYINQLRIVLAKHELSSGSSVSYTAMICGFNDANYFCNVFRSLVGISPSLYAKNYQAAKKNSMENNTRES